MILTPYFPTLISFLHMGGYAAYVWPAYAAACVSILINGILPGRQRRQLIRRLRNLL
jgi:heme exporter protein D